MRNATTLRVNVGALALAGLVCGCALSERASEKNAVNNAVKLCLSASREHLDSCVRACPASDGEAAQHACIPQHSECVMVQPCVKMALTDQTQEKDKALYYANQCLINLYKADDVCQTGDRASQSGARAGRAGGAGRLDVLGGVRDRDYWRS